MRKAVLSSLVSVSTLALVAVGTGCAVLSTPRWEPNDGSRGTIRARGGATEIQLLVLRPAQARDEEGALYLSVEIPKAMSEHQVSCLVAPFSARRSGERQQGELLRAVRAERLRVNFPPGPDDATTWKTFALAPPSPGLDAGPLHVSFRLDQIPMDFTRVLIGKPSTPRSRIVGAFAAQSTFGKKTVDRGVDYLGTISAKQRIRIPENAIAPGTEAFDAMVEFTEAPFEPRKSNVDTVMIRTEPARVGGTVPVSLVRFANKTVKPIRIKGQNGDRLFEITATLSPNATSGGFITILPDHTYQSTTALYPLLELQEISAAGQPLGEPMLVDSAVTDVPGFPFYLASSGGRWTETAPSGRLVTSASSDFHYDNGDVNTFIHSNGPGVPGGGVLSACQKAAAEELAP